MIIQAPREDKKMKTLSSFSQSLHIKTSMTHSLIAGRFRS